MLVSLIEHAAALITDLKTGIQVDKTASLINDVYFVKTDNEPIITL